MSFVWINAHEKLASVCELRDELIIVDNEFLNEFATAKIAQIAENRHEPLRLEWEGVHVNLCIEIWRINDTFVLNLVREEGGDDGEETGDDIVMADDVQSDGRYREELQGEIFDRSLRLAIGEKVCVDDAMVDTCEMRCCSEGQRDSS